MDSAVYNMGVIAGAKWLAERIAAGTLADVREMVDRSPASRVKFADQLGADFGLSAQAGGMAWDQYKLQAYALGWLAGFYIGLVEETQHGEYGDLLIGLLAVRVRA